MAKRDQKAGKTKNLANAEHDEGAAREAERRMTLRDDAGSDDEAHTVESETKAGTSAEMDREHDAGALKEASERMLLRRDRK
jgi:hypothetical protein